MSKKIAKDQFSYYLSKKYKEKFSAKDKSSSAVEELKCCADLSPNQALQLLEEQESLQIKIIVPDTDSKKAKVQWVIQI